MVVKLRQIEVLMGDVGLDEQNPDPKTPAICGHYRPALPLTVTANSAPVTIRDPASAPTTA